MRMQCPVPFLKAGAAKTKLFSMTDFDFKKAERTNKLLNTKSEEMKATKIFYTALITPIQLQLPAIHNCGLLL